MSGWAARPRLRLGAIALWCLLVTGCAGIRHEPPTEPVVTVPPAAPVPVVEPPVPTQQVPEATARKRPATVAAARLPIPAVAPHAAVAPVVAQPTTVPLDFKALGTRLKETRAIGGLTKLSLKNQVDDMVDRFRAYHRGQGAASLADLRRTYDMLLLKVLSLLQDSDPVLARDIVRSRAAIWGILADPRKFTESSLMAGANP